MANTSQDSPIPIEVQNKANTCLSDEPHDIITDSTLHYLGCLEFSRREEFASQLDPPTRDALEVKLRRSAVMRELISTDSSDARLEKNVTASARLWRQSHKYRNGLPQVQEWRSNKGLENGATPIQRDSQRDSQRDLSTECGTTIHLKLWNHGRVAEFPLVISSNVSSVMLDLQKQMSELLPELDDKAMYRYLRALAFPRHLFADERETRRYLDLLSIAGYFHVPSNNMKVSHIYSSINTKIDNY